MATVMGGASDFLEAEHDTFKAKKQKDRVLELSGFVL